MNYPLGNPPTVTYQTPLVTNNLTVASYGITANDVVIAGAQPPIYVEPALGMLIPWSGDPIPSTVNPIGRELDMAIANPADEIVIVSSRNNLHKVLNCFLFAPGNRYHRDFRDLRVSRIGNTIYFGNPNLDPGVVNYAPPSLQLYGIPFEELATQVQTPNMLSYFRYNRLTLLNTVTLIVRSEIDSVDEQGNYIELKTVGFLHGGGRGGGRGGRGNGGGRAGRGGRGQQDYFRNLWGQVFLGRASSLVLALIQNTEQPSPVLQYFPVNGDRVTNLDHDQLYELAQVTEQQLERFVSYLAWVIQNVQPGVNRMSYTVPGGFVLA